MDHRQRIEELLLLPWSSPERVRYSARHLLGNRRFVAYGAGDGLITFTTFVLEKYHYLPEVILDQKFTTPGVWRGIPALSPGDFRPGQGTAADILAVVTVGKAEYHAAIFDGLRQSGFVNIILASDIFEQHLSHAPVDFIDHGASLFAESRE